MMKSGFTGTLSDMTFSFSSYTACN